MVTGWEEKKSLVNDRTMKKINKNACEKKLVKPKENFEKIEN